MKYLELIEDNFKCDIKHYKKMISKALTSNRDLEELIKKLNEIVDFFVENIQNDDYILTSQDIVEHLGLSRHFVDKNIVPFLDIIYLPTSKEGAELFKQVFFTKINKLLVLDYEQNIRIHIEKLMHSKFLISKRSYIKYLNEIVTINTSNYADMKVNFEKACNDRFNIFNIDDAKRNFNMLPIGDIRQFSKERNEANIIITLNFGANKSINKYYLINNYSHLNTVAKGNILV